MSQKKSSSISRCSESSSQGNGVLCNSTTQYPFFELLERIKEKVLQPYVQIYLAKSIIEGLDKMSYSEFFMFEYKRFIEEISNYDWKNPVVAEYLEHAIKKILRIKYVYVDLYQQQIYQPNWIEQSIRSNFTFGQREASSDQFDSNSIILQSEIQSPQSTPLRMSIASSQYKLDEEETKNMFENCFTPNSQNMLQMQQAGESKARYSQNSMAQSSAHKQ